jgi:outer membrane protein TolC
MQSKITALLIILIIQNVSAQEIHNLDYYKTLAYNNNPGILENKNLAGYNVLQNNLSVAQFRRPQINISSDYLFAPFFFNRDRFISITQNPERTAYGYDVALSNGGLYAAQINASVPLFTARLTNTYLRQNSIQNDLLGFKSRALMHELDKQVTEQYVAVYKLQQQIIYQQNIFSIVDSRRKIAEQLVQKGLMQQNDFLLLDIEIKQLQYDVQQLRVNISDALSVLNNTCLVSDTAIPQFEEPQISKSPVKSQFNYQAKFVLDSTAIAAQQDMFNTRYRPQLSAFGNAGLNATNTIDLPHNTGISAGLHFVFPIYDGGQKKIVMQQNSILIRNLQLYQQQNTRLITNNLAALQQQINLTTVSLNTINQQLSSQETLLQIIRDKVINGQVSVTDYLNALQNYSTANQNKIQAQANLWLLINQFNYINW